ncbi:MAG: OsmC family protein [Gemmatimonadota bacterium]
MQHNYATRLEWTGNTGSGTSTYAGYSRNFTVQISGRPDLLGSADAHFRGDAARHNPEDLFIAAISSCHMLAYLALCARAGVTVVSYEDQASGILLTERDGSGRFQQVTLRPAVAISAESDAALGHALHEQAHQQCFIANSCSVAISNEPVITQLARAAQHA